ncbi:hypothetical protein Tco_0000565 [Tanacetum coccineum]
MSAMLSSVTTFSMDMFPFGNCPEGNGDVSSVYGCLKGDSGNSREKRLAISMVKEAWLSEKEEDFQDSPDDEEDTRSSQEYLNDLEEECQARALLDKSKRFFKKGTQRLSSAKATDQTECHKCVQVLQLPKPQWLRTKVLSLKPMNRMKKCHQMVEVKVLMALAEDNDVVSKKCARNSEWVKISTKKVHILLEMEDNDDKKNYLEYLILLAESQRNTTDPPVAVTDSSKTAYDSANESLVYNTPVPSLKRLDGAEPVSRPKTIE